MQCTNEYKRAITTDIPLSPTYHSPSSGWQVSGTTCTSEFMEGGNNTHVASFTCICMWPAQGGSPAMLPSLYHSLRPAVRKIIHK
jgi:hypothetical protein